MATIRLKWRNRVTSDAIRVYRATSPFDEDSLPPVLDTLSGSAEEYEDDVSTEGTYYYAVAAVKTGSPLVMAVSSVQSVEVFASSP